MNNDHWLRAKELLADLSEVPADEQAALMTAACAGDAGLQAELQRLMALDDAADAYFAGLGETLGRIDMMPAQIGAYRIAGEIGRGGMGTVYLGQRNDGQFKQDVAIKVVRHGVGGNLLARFRDERRILAQLKHPGIAYLLDGGSLPDGRPYFVMEYVQGDPITTHADHKRLDIHTRLELFRDVCAAVAHAHRNLVIHRDLKPGNVMVQVDDQGHASIKLLDFGIARIIASGPGDDPRGNGQHPSGDPAARPLVGPAAVSARAPTEYGERVLTPRYAAPEQIRGEQATTASDVYALGVLLHELLTGMRPFGSTAPSSDEMEREILEGAPALPSVTASRIAVDVATLRGSTARRLGRRLRGDLDSIVLKAIHREPEQRYLSVSQLADDVRRHIEGNAVTARHATAAYRAGLFLRRHRRGAALAFLALGASVALASLHLSRITHERDLARTEAAKAEQISNLLVGILQSADPANARGKEVTVREVLDRASGNLGTELAGQPAVRANMQGIIGSVYAHLGEYDKAATLLNRALRQRQRLYGPRHPKIADTQQDLAVLAWLRGRDDEAERWLRAALQQRLAFLGAEHLKVASAQNDLAAVLRRQGELEEAEMLYRKAIAIRSKQLDQGHEDLVSSRNNLAVLLQDKGQFDAAEALYRQVLAVRRKTLGPTHPKLANSLGNLGVLLRGEQRYAEAERLFSETLEMREKLYGDHHPLVAHSMDLLASVLRAQGRYGEAERHYRKALGIRRAALEPGHRAIASSLNNLAKLYGDMHDDARAEPLYRQAIAIYRKSLGADHPWTATSIKNLGELYLRTGSAQAAETQFREALRIRMRVYPADHWLVAEAQSLLGAALAGQGRLDAAEPLLNSGYLALQKARGDDDRLTRDARARLVALREARRTDA